MRPVTVEQMIHPSLPFSERERHAPAKGLNGLIGAEREDNKLKLADRAAHQWYRFVLSYPPHIVRDYVAKFGLDSRHRVLDPFCGTGTTAVECSRHIGSVRGLMFSPRRWTSAETTFSSFERASGQVTMLRSCLDSDMRIFARAKRKKSDAKNVQCELVLMTFGVAARSRTRLTVIV